MENTVPDFTVTEHQPVTRNQPLEFATAVERLLGCVDNEVDMLLKDNNLYVSADESLKRRMRKSTASSLIAEMANKIK